MANNDERLSKAAQRFDELTADLNPQQAKTENTQDLRAVAEAAERVRDDDARLREAVERARAHGRSWNQIALVLGVSRQAARQRFSTKAPA